MKNKTAIILGATGLVGKQLVNELLNSTAYDKVIVLARRGLAIQHQKIEEHVLPLEEIGNFNVNQQVDECFCALGTTQKKSGKQGLRQVDFDFVVATANLCKKIGVNKFLVVSSQGANAKSPFFYMRTKGEMEEAVKNLGIETVYIVRPSLITGEREETRIAEKFGYYLYKLLTPLMVGKFKKIRPVSGNQIAKGMLALAGEERKGTFTIESDFLQDY